MKHLLIVMAVVILAAPAAAQGPASTAVAVEQAPVYVTPDPSRTPLRVAAQGTVFKVLAEEGAWTRVQFQDPQWGPRTGYVQTSALRFQRPELTPMDLSVREDQPAPAPAPVPRERYAVEPPERRQSVRAERDTGFERGWLDVNLGGAGSAQDAFTLERTFTLFREDATARVTYGSPTGASFDFGGGFMFTRSLGVGVTFGGTAHLDPTGLYVNIPHPTVFNRHASDTSETDRDFERVEGAVHLHLMGAVDLSPRARFRLFGGPSYFRVQQDLVSDISYDQLFTLLGSNQVEIRNYEFVPKMESTGWGFHVGADVSYFFTRVVGVGALVRFSRAELEAQNPFWNEPFELKAGGVQFGGGLRLKF